MLVRGAKAIIVDDDGFVLVVRRSDSHPHVPLTPDLPGGKIEEGETFVEGLIREIKEETAIEVLPSAISFVGSTGAKDYYGKDLSLELYEVKLDHRPEVSLSFEHDSYQWVAVKDLQIAHKLFEPLVEAYKVQRTSVSSELDSLAL